MTINRKRIIMLVTLLTIFCLCPPFALGQQPTTPEPQLLRTIVYNGDIVSLLPELAETFNVTIGFEIDPRQPKSRIKIEVRDASLHNVLNAIVQSDPRYKWRENDRFIEIYPVEGSNPLLETVITSLQVNDVDQVEAINQLMMLPEVKTSMKMLNMRRRDIIRTSAERRGKAISLGLEGVTVRQALHEIVKASGSNFWVLQRHGNSGDFFSISNSAR